MVDAVRTATLTPDLEPVQLLRPDGTLVASGGWSADLPADQLVELYRSMVVARALDTEFINLQRQGQLALYASCRGQEAAQVGSAAALVHDDWVFPQYRELGVFVHRGMDVAVMSSYWRGSWHASLDPAAERCAPFCIPIATQTLHAVGYAMGIRLDGDRHAVITYFGDGASSEGDTHEAMNFAAVYEAPCVFFLQNNQWAISVPVSSQTRAPSLAHRGIGYGIPSVRCDGNDVLACHAVTSWAIERARRGEGPSLIEAITYRIEAHTTSDDPSRYRDRAEVDSWRALDPISRLAKHLRRTGVWSDGVAAEIDQDAAERCARLRSLTVDAPDRDPRDLFGSVYADPPVEFERQAEAAAEWWRGGDQ